MKNKVPKTLKNMLYGGLISLGLAGGIKNASAQSPYERTIYDMFDHPVNQNKEWVDMNKSQKEAYVDSALKADKSNTQLWNPVTGYTYPGTLCGNMVGQLLTNFSGVSNLDTLNKVNFAFKHYGFSDNGKWKIPMQYVSTIANNGLTKESHAVGGVLEGDSAINFKDWSFIDSYKHTLTQPGNWDIVDGEPLTIKYYEGASDISGPPQILNDALKFEKKDGKYELTYKDPSVVLTNPKLDTIPPEMEFSFKDTITNNPENLILNYNIHDGEYLETKRYGNLFPFYYDFYSGHFLDEGYYKIDDKDNVNFNFNKTRENSTKIYPVYNKTGIIPLDKSEGEHKVIVSASDYKGKYSKGNVSTDTISYIIDTTKPEINASINKIEDIDSANVSINVQDKYIKDSKYSFNNSDWKYFSGDTSFNVKLKNGENKLKVSSMDKANNTSDLEEMLIFNKDTSIIPEIDSIKPEISYTGIENGQIYRSDISGNVYAFDEHLHDYGYILNGNKKSLKDKNGNFDFNLNTGDYNAQFYANDTYGNESLTETINFRIDKTTGLEDNLYHLKNKIYPNPLLNDATYDYLPSGQDIEFKLYNSKGQEVYLQKDEDNDGKMNINLSDYPKGIYVYKTSNGDSGKIIKK